ncbi:MAG: hypothetical protein L3V56_03545 [Candidatus Magnetoovum sp. WYHC-5]|nr:hypothetical protein [Candidatus Magnetoovum sp. WYHC-5]
MTFTDAFKNGIDTANKNWQLVLIYLGFTLISIVGVVAIAIGTKYMFNINLQDLAHLDSLKHGDFSANQFAKYLVPLITLLSFLGIYGMAIFIAFFYIYSASCGIIAENIKDETATFTMKAFFLEGNRLFLPIIGFLTLITVIIVFELILVIIAIFPLLSLIKLANSADPSIGTLTAVIVAFVYIVTCFFLFVGTFALVSYSTGIIAIDKLGPFGALKKGVEFLKHNTSALWLYVLLIIGTTAINAIIAIGGFIVQLIPLIGTFLSIPLQLAIYAFQGYLTFFIFATIFAYYWGIERPLLVTQTAIPLILPATTLDNSTPLNNTFALRNELEPLPDNTDNHDKAQS